MLHWKPSYLWNFNLALLALSLCACVGAFDENESGTNESAIMIGDSPAWAHFTTAQKHKQGKIVDQVIGLIDEIRVGKTNVPESKGLIQMATFEFNRLDVFKALWNAKTAGVTVQVVVNGEHRTQLEESRSFLMNHCIGTDAEKELCYKDCGSQGMEKSCFVICGNGVDKEGCITDAARRTAPDQRGGGVMHSKFFTFRLTNPSSGLDTSKVWFGSANMSNSNMKRFNDSVTIENEDLYEGFSRYFRDLSKNEPSQFLKNGEPDYYDLDQMPKRGYWEAGDLIRVFASPEAEGDLVERRLREITPSEEGCHVHVAMYRFVGRPAVIAELERLVAGGCEVRVAMDRDKDRDNERAKKYLCDKKHGNCGKIQVRMVSKLHSKLLLVKGKHSSSSGISKLVYTGSHNWTEFASTRNDELLVRIKSDALYERYLEHFEEIWPGKRRSITSTSSQASGEDVESDDEGADEYASDDEDTDEYTSDDEDISEYAFE